MLYAGFCASLIPFIHSTIGFQSLDPPAAKSPKRITWLASSPVHESLRQFGCSIFVKRPDAFAIATVAIPMTIAITPIIPSRN